MFPPDFIGSLLLVFTSARPKVSRHRASRISRRIVMITFATRAHAFLARTRLHHQSRTRVLSSSIDDLFESLLRPGSLEMAQAQNRSAFAVGEEDEWQSIDWKSVSQDEPFLLASPVETIVVRDRLVYLKRDDQIRLPGSQLSGNKARKMFSLSRLKDEQFPQCLVSYGGPQSNAMLALAAVVHFRNQQHGYSLEDPDRKRFIYYTKKLPRFLRNQPSGNLFRAQSLGMELCELSHTEYNRLFGGDWGGNVNPPPSVKAPVPGKSLWVPQGGACDMALAGTRHLAEEIVTFWSGSGKGRPLSVVLPGGTCSTALLLHRAMKDILKQRCDALDIKIVVVPCCGDEGYARRQMMSLNSLVRCRTEDIPSILSPAPTNARNRYFTFGEPNQEVLDTFFEMRDEHQVVLDLLYGAPSWEVMFRHWKANHQGDATTISPIASRPLMYVHSGGLEGISSQLLRYKYKNLVDLDEIQLP